MVDHPQTNEKVEKFFDIFEKKVKFFNSVDEFMNWYNFIRHHGAFGIERLETPAVIYYQRLPKGSYNVPIITGENWKGEMICR